MSSPRKRYPTHTDVGRTSAEPPVMSPPEITAAELPEPVADAKPPEPIETQSPADAAASSAIKARLAEMERAGQFQQAQATQQQRLATEPQPPPQQQPQMPAQVAKWL